MMVNNLNRVIRTILIMLIICALLLILVEKIVEPVFSDLIAQPISENIAKKASDYLDMPPTPESLAEFKQEALTNDWYDSNGQLSVEYRQLPNATEGTITVTYSETFLTIMHLSSSSNKVIYYQEPYDNELIVSTEEGNGEQNTTVYEDQLETELQEEPSDLTTESIVATESIVEVPAEEIELPQTVPSQETEQLSKDRTEVILTNTEASSEEHGVALYVDGAYFDAFLSKQDALELAAFVKNAKIIDLVTSRVVWESK